MTVFQCKIIVMCLLFFVLFFNTNHAVAADKNKKPNILVIWGDDISWNNPSCYHRGMMGYQTPNIDRLAKEGAMFTDWYGQQSCTAGRAAFIKRKEIVAKFVIWKFQINKNKGKSII